MEEDIKEKLRSGDQAAGEAKEEVLKVPEVKEAGAPPNAEDLQKAKQMVEQMQIDDGAKTQVASAAQNLAGASEQEKIEQLLKLARQKGVIFAVKAAQKMNDPFVLDMLHDKLAEGGYYKEFLK